MINDGYPFTGDIIPGVMHRFRKDGKSGKQNEFCKMFPDMRGGIYGSWNPEETINWQAVRSTDMTPAERRDNKLSMARAIAERDAIQAERAAEARGKAAAIWDAAEPANDDHPYLQRKQVSGKGLRQSRDAIVVPMRDIEGTLHSLQFIYEDGSKRFLGGGRVKGCYMGLGKPDGRLYIAEGYATAATVRAATGEAVAVAFNAGNLEAVALTLRARFPDAEIIITADNDTSTPGNPGMTKALSACKAAGARMISPEDGDFNDLAITSGLPAVTAVLVPANDNKQLAAVDVRTEAERMTEDWVFVATQKRFVNVVTMASLDVDGFNMAHLHIMGWFPAAGKMKPAEYLRRVVQSRVVHDVMYLPSVYDGDPFFTKDGVAYMNTYNHTNIPNVDPNWQQHDAWQICLSHLQNILPNEWEYVLHWMAHNVQHPGEKILWSPIIIGVQGDGKTALSEILRAVMGSKHTTVVGQEAIHSDFNSWAEGSCVVTFEEIRVPGHSRFDFMNKVKPLLTNQIVSITAKGKNQRDVPNTQNYMALSNFRDALALDDDDRRWAVFFTRYDSREHLKKCTNAEYWVNLYD